MHVLVSVPHGAEEPEVSLEKKKAVNICD